jgi:hypothetical protein
VLGRKGDLLIEGESQRVLPEQDSQPAGHCWGEVLGSGSIELGYPRGDRRCPRSACPGCWLRCLTLSRLWRDGRKAIIGEGWEDCKAPGVGHGGGELLEGGVHQVVQLPDPGQQGGRVLAGGAGRGEINLR